MAVPEKMRYVGLIVSLICIHTASSLRLRNQATHHSRHYSPQQQQHHQQQRHSLDESDNLSYEVAAEDEPQPMPAIEVDSFQCPLGCVCQYAHFMDLPISRWINSKPRHEDGPVISNEVIYEEGDDTYNGNPFIKQATCILQADERAQILVQSLPADIQALVLLYTGIGKIKMVNTSEFLSLTQLSTLEIRGPQDLSLRLEFDKPLSSLRHANFDSIKLLGSENSKRPPITEDPSKSFDYKPFGEEAETGEDDTESGSDSYDSDSLDEYGGHVRRAKHKRPIKETLIMPYDMYKRSRMPNFFGWQRLEVLRIRGCSLNELHWEMFDGLDAVQHLSLEANEIATLPPFAFYGAMHLRTLSLAHNNISGLHYRDLAGLLELEALDLSDNRLGELSELSFPPFPKLERVDFRHNPIRYIYPATFWVMNGTRSMQLLSDDDAEPLELWGNLPFESLDELEELTIENLLIPSLEQNVFKGLRSLGKLKLRGHIRRIEFDAFSSLGELGELDLGECHIEELSMDAFVGLRKLRVLNLANNQLAQIPSGLFDEQARLEEIYLEGNQLQTLPSNFFLMPKLRLARLNENPWQCSCDMATWRQKITNQERGPAVDHCITDYFSGKKVSCRRSVEYKFNNRFAPRCENFNKRGVFYVLRKHLQCDQGGRLIRSGKHRVMVDRGRVPTWRKIELLQQQQGGGTKEEQRPPREQKFRAEYSKRQNSLHVALQQRQQQHRGGSSEAAREEESNTI